MQIDELLALMQAQLALVPSLETAGFYYSPSQVRSFMLREKVPPFVWVNTDGLLAFNELDTSRTYNISLRLATLAGKLETNTDANRLLLQASSLASGYIQEFLGAQLKRRGLVGRVDYKPFYMEDADVFTGYHVSFSVTFKSVCVDPISLFMLPDGGSLLLPDES